MKHLIIATLLMVALAGCVSNKDFDIERQRSLEMQRQQVILLERFEDMRNEMLKDRNLLIKYGYDTELLKGKFAAVDSLSRQVNRVNDILTKQADNLLAAQTLADDLRFLINRISTLQEEFSDNNRLLIEFRKANEEHKDAVNTRLSHLEQGLRAPQAKEQVTEKKPITSQEPEVKTTKPAEKPAQTRQAEPGQQIVISPDIPKASSTTEQQAYDNAKAAYDRRQFDRSISLFEEYLQRFPNQPLAVNAHYWIAESHYALLDYINAFRVFRMVSTNYSTSPKAPDALVKMALCNWKMGDFSGARQDLNRVRSTYPNYERMSLVNRLLSEIPQ